MKYIIVSREIFAGDSKSDSPTPSHVTEIATELVITRLKLIELLQTGTFTIDDCVVTREERKCLYTKIFKHVFNWDEYTKALTPGDTTIDLLEPELFMRMAGGPLDKREIPYMPFYQRYETDKEMLNNVEWSDITTYDTSIPFVVFVIRMRSARPLLNIPVELWQTIIDKFKSNNIPIFVFGKETEMFTDGTKVQFIKNFQDWCTIARHKNCMHVASTMTGGVYPILLFGNTAAKMTIIDNNLHMAAYSPDPSFYHDCINFSKIPITFINEIPTADTFYNAITSQL